MKTWRDVLRGKHSYYLDFGNDLPVLEIYEEGNEPPAHVLKVSFSMLMYLYCRFHLDFIIVHSSNDAHVTLDEVYGVLAERPKRPSLNRGLELALAARK